ncbi:MAG: thiol reductase thioredoxin [Deltaproteobacteria bacterium RBG_13_43_22]|nr:MAG: thiol reductase thioredoxin [Deltaproteobacteria bacterium RBG_13_43_22]
MEQPKDGLILFCKKDCATCTMIVPVMKKLSAGNQALTIFTQDDPGFPEGLSGVIDDTSLEQSYHFQIETVPTLIRLENGQEIGRTVGWDREEWRTMTGIKSLGEGLPPFRPGCGAKNVEPGIVEELAVRFGGIHLASRRIASPPLEDEMETCFAHGWTDGLPVVPPTEVRVVRMLEGTTRSPDEGVGIIPPNQMACTVEKAAINAVMAGCKPEYLPVVLAAVEAACLDEFCLHGLLATTYFSGPVVIVNGPVVKAIGMNSGGNALGQGNRANATIGRALQLIVRNVGGGRPGEIDRAALGNPGKYTFCFAEDEPGSPWEPLSVERGFPEETSTVTLFAGDGVQAVVDQLSRTPESLARSFALCLRSVAHPKIPMAADAVLVVSPEHGNIFRQAGWTKARLKEELDHLLHIPGLELVRGAQGIAEGIPEAMKDITLPKFRPGGLNLVHAGGTAGKFSAIIGGWVASGPRGSQLVTKEIRS